ncbi:beta-1,6-glucan synthase [Aromatoleum toluvorans]|uniref:Endo-1,3-beta-glucanase btgC n=1 Tax=Aromatoleum toluvorans TaxID=92002 RepID=A0ABX1PV57_9RHOO|nr:beta-1,6-glucan synthase [Aromatoleum toluvorans]NMG42371.1 beta-1,6-glucan synthase [Aromatoleum toluvorans]
MSPHTPTRPHDRNWLSLLLVGLAILLVLGMVLVQQTRPVPMHDLKLADGERLKCVSYAPYRLPGQTPFDEKLVITREQIAADLAALSKITECVRIYSVDQGLDQVPAVAREIGLKVLLGAWVNADPKRNMKQLDHAIGLANDYADVVRVLIVGNEVLLRRERTESEMRELIEYARARVKVPVTYADVWEFWLQHPKLAESVDWVTVHILPFWEDHPVAIDRAVAHVADVFDEVRGHFDKPLMIGETGWPSAGRQRQGSEPSQVNQARYIREFVHIAHEKGWNYNLIEAIDQPWKRRLEGTVGGYWGMLGTDLQPKFPLAGPVTERSGMASLLVGAGLGALLCLLLSMGTRNGPLRAAALGTTGAVAGMTAVLGWEHAQLAWRDPFEWWLLGSIGTVGLITAFAASRWSATTPLTSASEAWATLRGGRLHTLDAGQALGLLRGLLLFAAAIAALLLFADPRYRDFPVFLYLVPALVFGVTGWWAVSRHGVEEKTCGLVIAVCVIGRWLPEPLNPQAIAWLATGLLLAGPCLRAAVREHQQRKHGTHGGVVEAVEDETCNPA